MPSIDGILQVVLNLVPPVHGDDRVEVAIAIVEVDKLVVGREGASRVLQDGTWLTDRLRLIAAHKHRIRLKPAVERKGCVHLRRVLIEPNSLLAGAVVPRDRPGHAPLVYGLSGYTAGERGGAFNLRGVLLMHLLK